MPGPSLRELQQAFWDAVTRRDGVGADTPLLASIDPSDTLTPAERLDIYAGMYVARLTDVLREDFERVAVILGHERFHEAVHGYLARHPSIDPSVRHVGREFPAFLAGYAPDLPFLADLARLEWARLAVFDAPDPAPLHLDDLLRISPEDWPDLLLTPIAALEVLVSDWPVHRLWPADAGTSCVPERTALRVWRQEFLVYHAPMPRQEEVALARLLSGETFGAICEGFDDPETAAALLLRWIEDGLVAGLRAS